MNITMNNGSIKVNGKSYSGSNISINNGEVIVDGKTERNITGVVHVTVIGDIETLSNENGNVTANLIKNANTTNGDIKADIIEGDVSTVNGDIASLKITGSVSSVNGDISYE